MAKPPTSPLKITAHLQDGRLNSADGVVMFDSILYHAWFWKHCPEVLEGMGNREYDGYMGLPLRHLPGNRWAASKAIYKETGRTVEYLNKRPNFFNPDKLERLNMEKGVISDSVGAYRAYRMPNVIRTVKDGILTFFAVGRAEKVRELLETMSAVGKKAAAGYGIVDCWTVEETDADYTLLRPESGLMRPVEVGDEGELDLSGYPVMRYGIRPPYWKQKNARLCYVPIR